MGQGTTVLRAEASRLQDDIRTMLAELEYACPRRPEPKNLVKDVLRGRPASDETLLVALLAVVRTAPLDAVLRFMQQFFARLVAEQEPATAASAWPTFIGETAAQGTADADQMRALHAIESGDRVTIDRAIESSVAHLWQLMSLIRVLTAAKASIYKGRVTVARRIAQ